MLAAIIVITVGLVAYALTKDTSAKIPEPKTVQEALTHASPTPAPMPKAESPKPSPRSLAAPAAPLSLPRYPVGLELRFAGKRAVVKKAWQDGQGGWHFLVDVDAGMPFGIGNMKDKAVSEQFVRDVLANQLKQTLAPDQAFPAKVEVYRNGKGGLIESVSKSPEGLWLYAVRGRGAPVSQGKLLDELVSA
jgi:hypothetical protein